MQHVTLTELPISRLALWSSRMGWFALTVTCISLLVTRSGIWEAKPAIATFAAALICAALAILLALISFVIIWRRGYKGFGCALRGLLFGLLLLAYPAYLGFLGSKLPMINDITTDTGNPPQFNALAYLRPRGTTDYPGAKVAELQRSAYPDIAPLQLDIRPAAAYNVILTIINKRRWRVVDARPPETRRDGIIEAVARTPIMGLRHDVIVRVSASNNGTRVDARSASRFGTSDFGTNAKRLRELMDDIDDAAGAAPANGVQSEKKPGGRKW